MATVAEVMDEAARECSITPPSSWITATTLSHAELKDFLKQTAKELLDRVDWPDPIAQDYEVTGDGTADYSLPAAFKRLTRDELAVYETSTVRRAAIPVSTNGAWTHLTELGSAAGNRYFRITGDEEAGYEIEFYAVPAVGQSITVSYISKNWLKTSGTAAAVWTNVADTLLLPEDLIRMGVIWRFRRRKGLPYADRMAEYEAILARRANDSRIIRKITFGEREEGLPMRTPIPDYIPPA